MGKGIYKITFLFFLFAFFPAAAFAASMAVTPSIGTYEVGQSVTVRAIVTSSTPLNAISLVISVPPIFSIVSASKSSSILDFWITEPTVSSGGGTVKLEGAALNGFNGQSGTVVTINLRAVKKGTGRVSFQSGQIFANDGNGTDITGTLAGAFYTVNEKTVPKPTTPPPPALQEPKIETPPPTIPVPAPTPAPELKAPEISLDSSGAVPVIRGTSGYVNTQAILTFTTEDGSNIILFGNSDGNGSFSVLVPNAFKHGYYVITAVMVKEDKTPSQTSNMILVKIGNIFSDISLAEYVVFAILIFIIFCLLLYIIFRPGRKEKATFSEYPK